MVQLLFPTNVDGTLCCIIFHCKELVLFFIVLLGTGAVLYYCARQS
jgi:hypothetical protein